MTREWNAVAEQHRQLAQPATVTAKNEFFLKQHEAEEIRALTAAGSLEGFADRVHLETQATGPVEGMGGLLTRAELRLYAVHLQEVAQQQFSQAAAAMSQQLQATGDVDASSIAAAAAAAGAAAAAAGIPLGPVPGNDWGAGPINLAAAAAAGGGASASGELQQQPQGRGRARSNAAVAAVLGQKRPRGPYRDHQCSQCGRVKKEATDQKHIGKSKWPEMRCPYTCINCDQPMAAHHNICKHG
jgi:hypothetical protein